MNKQRMGLKRKSSSNKKRSKRQKEIGREGN